MCSGCAGGSLERAVGGSVESQEHSWGWDGVGVTVEGRPSALGKGKVGGGGAADANGGRVNCTDACDPNNTNHPAFHSQ